LLSLNLIAFPVCKAVHFGQRIPLHQLLKLFRQFDQVSCVFKFAPIPKQKPALFDV